MRTPARFARLAAAFVATVAIITGSTISAAPAFADGVLTLSVYDLASSTMVPGFELTIVNDADSSSQTATTDSSGLVVLTLPAGSYTVTTEDDGVHKVESRTWTVGSGQTSSGFYLTRHGMMTGTVPAGVVGHVTISALTLGSPWTAMPGTVSWSGNTFTYVFDDDHLNNLDYWATLFFDVDDTVPYRDSYLGGHTTPPANGSTVGSVYVDWITPTVVDPIGLIGASFVSGVVSGAFGDIEGATVTAQPAVGAGSYTATTDANGAYTIVLPAGDGTYTASVVAPGYSPSSAASAAVSTANNWRATSIDFTLATADAQVSGTIIDENSAALAAAVRLYTLNPGTGIFDTTPVSFASSSDIDIPSIGPGTYRIALVGDAGLSLPISGYTASNIVAGATVAGPHAVSAGRAAGDCYIEFTVAANEGDYVFDDVTVDSSADPSACYAQPWAGTIEGTVTNYAGAGALTAELYSSLSYFSAIDSVPVSADGHYELQGIETDADYFVLIRTADDAEWFDTWSDGTNGVRNDPASVTGIPLVAGASASGVDVTLIPAAIFSGTVTSGGDPVDGACVQAIQYDDNSNTWCVLTDAAGLYSVKVPIGTDYFLSANALGYDDGFYGGSSPVQLSGAAQHTATSLDIELDAWPPAVFGYVYSDGVYDTEADDVTVHLYAKIGTGWAEVAHYDPDPDYDGYFYFDQDEVFPDGDGLPAGDYRLRFESDADGWLAISETDLDGSVTALSPNQCFISLDDLRPGPTRAVFLAVNAGSTVACGDEPTAANGTVTGSLVESVTLGAGPVAGQQVVLKNSAGATVATATTDSSGEYAMPNIAAGTYSIVIPTRDHVLGEHSYVEQTVTHVLVAGGAAVAPIELVRYGNIEGQIDDWVPTSVPSTITAYQYDWSLDTYVQVGSFEAEIDDDGFFELPAIYADDNYFLRIDGPDDAWFVDGYFLDGLGGIVVGSGISGTAELDYALTAVTLEPAQHIRGVVTTTGGSPIAGATVGVYVTVDPSLPDLVMFETRTAADGSYDLRVMAATGGFSLPYPVRATADGYYEQWWQSASCDCASSPVEVGEAGDPATAGINFTLLSEDAIVFDQYFQYEMPDPSDPSQMVYPDYPGVVTHLYKQVTGGWQEVASAETNTLAYTLAEVHSDGNYRVRFSIGARWLALLQHDDWSGPTPTAGEPCYLEYTALELGDYITTDLVLDDDTAPGACGAEPAIVPAGPSSTGGTGATGITKTAETTPEPTSELTSEPTVTPTPAPTAIDEPATQPGRPGVVKPDAPTGGGADLTWLFWLAGVLVLLVLAGGAVYLVRRRP